MALILQYFHLFFSVDILKNSCVCVWWWGWLGLFQSQGTET